MAIEQAIEVLLRLDFPDSDERAIVRGAEWWVQRRRPKETIGFHYDKDEAMASDRGILRCPTESTVTYLGDAGGPTFIVNRTTPDGNGADPLLPRRATAVYPRRNRHVVFRGNLAHGVAGDLSHSTSGKRITLLVNWWQEKPMEPNCVYLSDDVIKQVGVTPLSTTVSGLRGSHAAAEHKNVSCAAGCELERHSVQLRATDHFHFMLPKGGSEPAHRGDGVLELDYVTWERQSGRELVWSQVGQLDLDNNMLMNAIWRSIEPKVVVWHTPERSSETKDIVLPAARKYLLSLKFYLADPVATSDALEAFGLSVANVRERGGVVAVVHDTHQDDTKFVMDNGVFSAETLESFLRRFNDGKLAPLQLDDDEL